MTDAERDDQLLLHAADALEPGEREELEAWLAESGEEGEHRLDEARATYAGLALALDPKRPPAQLKETLLSRAEHELSDTAPSRAEAAPRRGRSAWLAAAAAVVAAVVSGGAVSLLDRGRSDEQTRALSEALEAAQDSGAELREANVELRSRNEELLSQNQELADRVAALTPELERLRTAAAGERERSERLASDLARNDADSEGLEDRIRTVEAQVAALEAELRAERAERRAQAIQADNRLSGVRARLRRSQEIVTMLRGSDVAALALAPVPPARGSANVFWDYGSDLCYAHATSLAPSGGSQRYALWIADADGKRALVGELEEHGGGDATLFGRLPLAVDEIAETLVTLEPGAPGAAPRGAVVLRHVASREDADPNSEADTGPRRRNYRRR